MNREIYLARLHNAGLELSGIEFRLTRRDRAEAQAEAGAGAGEGRSALPERPRPLDLPQLDEGKRATIEVAVAGLEEPLRSKVAHAMEMSMRRQEFEEGEAPEK